MKNGGSLVRTLTIIALVWLSAPGRAAATSPSLTIETAKGVRAYTAQDLLARSDARTIKVEGDIYHGTIAYRAVPLLALLEQAKAGPADAIEAKASDGFASEIPLALIAQGARGGAVALIAVEDPANRWPTLPDGSQTAGPFYLVWEHPERSNVSREQWPYQVVSLTAVETPAHRWPQIAVPASVPADAPARRGQAVFVANCLPCHRMKGGGTGTLGPDLGQPMSPTHYLTDRGLRALIRDPKQVRTWPAQQMPGFDAKALPDADLDAVVAYLHTMAGEP
jgi:mono/diheme cytochrome c family protein